jgi:hypothetical protein
MRTVYSNCMLRYHTSASPELTGVYVSARMLASARN